MCAGWTDTQQTSIPLSGTVSHSGNHTGNWRVIRYTFSGNPVFGGTGILRIEGLRRASATGPVLARAQLEQNMSVNLRGCSTANSTAAQNSIGLLAIGPEMNVQKTQILALDPTGNPNAPALVHCISCQQIVSAASCPSDALCHDSQAIGRWNFGQLPFPQVPQPPASLAAQPLTVSTTTELRVGSSNGGLCQLDGSGISHCRLSSLTINGNNILKVVYPASNSSSTIQRQLRLYLDGDLTISGGGKICQAIEDGTASPPCTLAPWSVGLGPTSLQLYGRSASSCGSGQSLTIAGGPQALSLFALLPCADVKINGGSSSPDIYGAIWSRSYQPTGSGNVDIWVPPDLNAALQNSLGSQFSIAIPRPIALGINRWVSYESVR